VDVDVAVAGRAIQASRRAAASRCMAHPRWHIGDRPTPSCARRLTWRRIVNGNTRPSSFFVVWASRRTQRPCQSTCRHSSGSTSDAVRQPVTNAKRTTFASSPDSDPKDAGGREPHARLHDVRGMIVRSQAVQLEVQPAGTAFVSVIGVGPQFFETIGLPIVRGRPFSHDEVGATGVAVISESAARGGPVRERQPSAAEAPHYRQGSVGDCSHQERCRAARYSHPA